MMRATRHQTMRSRRARPGVALLLVLASMVVGLSAVSVLAQVRLSARLTSDAHERSTAADAAIDATLPLIDSWLRQHAGSVVLPPTDKPPRIAILDQQLTPGLRMQITAWDQCGMRPLVDDGSFQTRTRDPLTDLDQITPDTNALDAVFPSPDDETIDQPAIGARLTTHNPPPSARDAPWLINANTAPISIIRDVFRESQRGGLDQLIERRGNGEPAIVGLLEPRTSGGRPIQLVAASSAWSFRIDATAETVTRSWWLVYTRTQNGWRLAQRVRIDR